MSIVWIVCKIILGYLVLMYLSINLIGLILRSFFIRGLQFGAKDYKIKIKFNTNNKEILIGFIGILLLCLYFYILLYKFHWGFTLASIIIMTTRVPDLLWEIIENQKITKQDWLISSSLSSILGLFLEIGVVVLICYSVYKS